MRNRDDFEARLERTQANAEKNAVAPSSSRGYHRDRNHSFAHSFWTALFDVFGDALTTLWFWFIFAAIGVGFVAFGLGISLFAALGVTIAGAVALFAVKALMFD